MQNPEKKRKNEENRAQKEHQRNVRKIFFEVTGENMRETVSPYKRSFFYDNTLKMTQSEIFSFIESNFFVNA